MSDPARPRVPTDADPEPAPRATFGQTLAAVLWSFFGVRKGKDMRRDATLNPLHVILIGIAMAALLVFGLLLLVHTIVH